MEKITTKELAPIKTKFEALVGADRFTKEASFALQAINRNNQLLKANKDSILEAVLNVAQTGLSLNPVLNLAYLVPRYDRLRGTVCQLMPSYQGLVKLLTDSGSVVIAYAHIVRENDEFEQSLGTNPDIKHSPKLSNRGPIVGAYAVGVTKDGNKQVEVMSLEELHYIRDMSETYKAHKAGKIKSCTWVEWEGEMCKKTVLKRLTKYLPKTERYETVATAIDIDNQDYILDPDSNQATFILRLLMSCTLPEHEVEDIENKVLRGEIQKSQVNKLIDHLQDHQPDPIRDRGAGSMKDVHRALDAKMEDERA